MSKQKKRWYDYLWIASLTYLVLGFFNILFAWLGLICFLVPLIISIAKGTKGYSQVDEKQMVSVRFPDFLFCDVFSDALEYLFGFCRSAGLKTSHNTALDIQITLELGISRDTVPSGRCTVCLWLLQRDADFDRAWTDYDGTV